MKAVKNKQVKIKSFPLSDEELHKQSETDSGIILRKNCRCRIKLNYSALPVGSTNFKKAIYDELNCKILNYNSELNDMILRYSNIRVITPIVANRCRKFNVICISDIYVFKPHRDSILTGNVNKISNNHIGCLIYDIFNVSIIKPPDLPYDQWAGRDITLNEDVTFKVIKVDVSEIIPYIIGELINKTDNSMSDSVIYSDLEDVLESIDEVKSTKGKLSISSRFSSENLPNIESITDLKSKKRKHSDKFANKSASKKRRTE